MEHFINSDFPNKLFLLELVNINSISLSLDTETS